MKGATVGIYDASLPENHQFIMNSIPVSWGSGQTQVSVGCGGELRLHFNIYIQIDIHSMNIVFIFVVFRCFRFLCLCAVLPVPQELIKFSRKEGQSAAMTAYPVQQARSVI